MPTFKDIGDRKGLWKGSRCCEQGKLDCLWTTTRGKNCYKGQAAEYWGGLYHAKGPSSRPFPFTLKDQAQGLAFELGFREKALEASYNKVVPLRQELFEAKASQVSLWGELAAAWTELIATAKEKTQHSHTKLKALRDFPREF